MGSNLIFCEMGWLGKQISKLLIGLFDDLHSYLSKQGVVIENFFKEYGQGNSILAFNLDRGNIYGVYAAKIYVACISIMVLLVGLVYMYQILRTTVSPSPNKIAEVKENLVGLAIGILLVGFGPYIIDALIRLRGIILSSGMSWLGLDMNGNAVYGLYKQEASKSLLGTFMLLAYVGCSFYLAFVYITIALMQTFYFAFFPIIALRGMTNRKLLMDWVRTFLMWMVIPFVDAVLLALPISVISQEKNIFLGAIFLFAFLMIRGFVYNKIGVDLGPSDSVAHKTFSAAAGSAKAIVSTVGKGVGAISGRVSDIASDNREAKKHDELSQIDKEKEEAERQTSEGGDDSGGHNNGGGDKEPPTGNGGDKEPNNNEDGSGDGGKGADNEDNGNSGGSETGDSTKTEGENGAKINDLDDGSREASEDGKSVPESVSDDPNSITVPVGEDNGDDGDKLSGGAETPPGQGNGHNDETGEGENTGLDAQASGEKKKSKEDDEWDKARKEVFRRYINVDNFDKNENKKVLSNEELAKMYRKRARKKMLRAGTDAVRAAGEAAGTIVGGAFGSMIGHETETASLGRAIVDSGADVVEGVYGMGKISYEGGAIAGKRAADEEEALMMAAMSTPLMPSNNGGEPDVPPEEANILQLEDYLSEMDPDNSSYKNKNLDDFVIFTKATGVERDSLYNIKREPNESADAYDRRVGAIQKRTLNRGREALRQVDYGNGKVMTGIDALRFGYAASVPSYKPDNGCFFGPTTTHREGQSTVSCEQLGNLLYFGKDGKENELLFKDACEDALMNISFDEQGNRVVSPFSSEQMEKYGPLFNDIFSRTGAIARCQEAASKYISGGGKPFYDSDLAGGNYAPRSYDFLATLRRPLTQSEKEQAEALDKVLNGNGGSKDTNA